MRRPCDPRHVGAPRIALARCASWYALAVSLRDPARFAFAHGGKDGTPFPVDRETYDRTIDVLAKAVDHARLDRSDRVNALKRLRAFHSEEHSQQQ